jgi:Ser/Thr protein kinase RdoA (MazF antagonist)
MGTAVVHHLVERGDIGDPHHGDGRAQRAATLAWLHGLLSTWPTPPALNERTTWRERRTHPIWRRAHNPSIDLNIAQPDAAWIDALALKALISLDFDSGALVLGHQAWCASNLRVEGDDVVMVLDWDSLYLASEAATVGAAAVLFPAAWPMKPSWPTPDEAAAFVSEYEDASERRFTLEERRVLRASAVYEMAYIARCEFVHHGAHSPELGSYRHALAVWANDYFDL